MPMVSATQAGLRSPSTSTLISDTRCSAPPRLRASRTVARARLDAVVPVTAVDPVFGRAATYRVSPVVAVQRIDAGAAIDRVGSRAAMNDIIAIAAMQGIGAAISMKAIVATIAPKAGTSAIAKDRIRPGVAMFEALVCAVLVKLGEGIKGQIIGVALVGQLPI